MVSTARSSMGIDWWVELRVEVAFALRRTRHRRMAEPGRAVVACRALIVQLVPSRAAFDLGLQQPILFFFSDFVDCGADRRVHNRWTAVSHCQKNTCASYQWCLGFMGGHPSMPLPISLSLPPC